VAAHRAASALRIRAGDRRLTVPLVDGTVGIDGQQTAALPIHDGRGYERDALGFLWSAHSSISADVTQRPRIEYDFVTYAALHSL